MSNQDDTTHSPEPDEKGAPAETRDVESAFIRGAFQSSLDSAERYLRAAQEANAEGFIEYWQDSVKFWKRTLKEYDKRMEAK